MNILFLLIAVCCTPSISNSNDDSNREAAIAVKPVFLVVGDSDPPTKKLVRNVMSHLSIAQRAYSRMLRNQDTFSLCDEHSVVRVPGSAFDTNHLSYLNHKPSRSEAVGKVASLLFKHFETDRYACPYVFFVILIDSKSSAEVFYGKTFNGTPVHGGGMTIMSDIGFKKYEYRQFIVQHELGHAFGLQHPYRYGQNIKTSRSIMSYNPDLFWTGTTPPRHLPRFTPQDLYCLGNNDGVFPRLQMNTWPCLEELPPNEDPMKIYGHNDFQLSRWNDQQ